MESILLAFLLGAMLAPFNWPAANVSDAGLTEAANGRPAVFMNRNCIPKTLSSPSPTTIIIYLPTDQ